MMLNLEERMQLEMGLNAIRGFEEVKLWGKIHGVTKDYFIALALNYTNQYEFPHKTFYWCSSGNWVFQELPPLNPRHNIVAEA